MFKKGICLEVFGAACFGLGQGFFRLRLWFRMLTRHLQCMQASAPSKRWTENLMLISAMETSKSRDAEALHSAAGSQIAAGWRDRGHQGPKLQTIERMSSGKIAACLASRIQFLGDGFCCCLPAFACPSRSPQPLADFESTTLREVFALLHMFRFA